MKCEETKDTCREFAKLLGGPRVRCLFGSTFHIKRVPASSPLFILQFFSFEVAHDRVFNLGEAVRNRNITDTASHNHW